MKNGKLIDTQTKAVYDTTIDDRTDDYYIICPVCTPNRKPVHQKERKLCITAKERTARCNHCDRAFKFVYDDEFKLGYKSDKIQFDENKYDKFLNTKVVKWFEEKRKISKSTLDRAGIKSCIKSMRDKNSDKFKSMLCMVFFAYYKNKLEGIKYRGENKNFAFEKNSRLILIGMERIEGKKEALIVEGEIDMLSYMEAGYDAVVTVPNGVSVSEDESLVYEKTGTVQSENPLNLKYIDAVIDTLDEIETIIIGTDADAGGSKLMNEIIRRIGKHKCKYIDYKEYNCKDGNQVLVDHGPEMLLKTIGEAKSFPIENVVTIEDDWTSVVRIHTEGYSRGKSTGYPALDPHFNWVNGDFIVLNGYPNMGKSFFALNLTMLSAIMHGMKWGCYLPENYPTFNAWTMLIEMFLGNTMDKNTFGRISSIELGQAKKFIKAHFQLINRPSGFTPQALRDLKTQLIRKKGIHGFLTDPWNSLIHSDSGKNLDDYLEKELSAEVRIATNEGLINFINAHPPTPRDKDKKELAAPSPYQIRGGTIWWAKAYEMLCVHNHYDEANPKLREVFVQKVKNHKETGIPTYNDYVLFDFDRRSGRYLQADGYNPFEKKYEQADQEPQIDYTAGF